VGSAGVAGTGLPYIFTLRTASEACSIIHHTSLRQHTSAYVSIRQHTSAYVSIRQQC
jgi:hypothetical protein